MLGGQQRAGDDARRTLDHIAVLLVRLVRDDALAALQLGDDQTHDKQIAAAAEETRFTAVAVSVRHVTATTPLLERHRDPFDRLLLAQALTEPLVLLTNDANLAAHGYPVRLLSSRLS